MELTGSSAGSSGSVSAGLGTHFGVKSKCLASAHLRGSSYKKPKKPAAVGSMVNTSAGSISLEDLGSDVSSIASSVSGLSDVENMTNLVAKETSYAESREDDSMNENTPRKNRT
ncbi:hypothetical protein G9A89_005141 [Geosiphon pyriformis]|nr:hypothetical protein G9A89_005141 [Geosiphon pyriformis]